MKNLVKNFGRTLLMASLIGTYSCEDVLWWKDSGDDSLFPSSSDNQPVPEFGDDEVTVSTIPSAVFTVSEENDKILNLNMTGIQSPDGDDFVTLRGTGYDDQNVWLKLDDELIGFSVLNGEDVATKASGILAKADLVFLVDNSGSMGDEANTLAEQIIEWSTELAEVMDIQFACVGYYGVVSGAIDFTDVLTFSDFLNYSSGTSRTMHFSDNLSDAALADASNYGTSGECGAAALSYAVNNFTFRQGANRIYVNLTDEGNQPGSSRTQWSVEVFNDESELYSWSASSGTIHTVWSGGSYYCTDSYTGWNLYTDENPTLMSTYTGGTMVIDAAANYSNVTLSDLPVTGAILNSFEFSFDYVETLKTGSHELTIIIDDADTNIKLRNTIPITIAE